MKAFRVLSILFGLALIFIIISAEFGLTQVFFGPLYRFPNGDVVGHLLLLGGLSFLVNLGFPLSRFKQPPLLKSCLILAGFITLEEISQIFIPNRSFSLVDLAANLIGIFGFGEAAAALRRLSVFHDKDSSPSMSRKQDV